MLMGFLTGPVNTEIGTETLAAMFKWWSPNPMTSLRVLLAIPLPPGQPTVCKYVKDQTLMVNVLWEVAYGGMP